MIDRPATEWHKRRMYLPSRFDTDDSERIFEVMKSHPFATVTTIVDGKAFVNHLPVTASKTPEGALRLCGHMARMNEQWRHMKAGSQVLIAFHGPHAYVNPSWYPGRDGVPTWNYVVVHADGKAEVIEAAAGLVEILRETVEQMNSSYDDQWNFNLPPAFGSDSALEKGIVGFVLVSPQITAKFKLSQHRSQDEIQKVIEGLNSRKHPESLATADWMARISVKTKD